MNDQSYRGEVPPHINYYPDAELSEPPPANLRMVAIGNDGHRQVWWPAAHEKYKSLDGPLAINLWLGFSGRGTFWGMRAFHSIAAGMICLALLGAAEQPDQGPGSPAAVAAIKRSEKSIADAEAQFRKAKGEAQRQLVADLEQSKAEAMKSGQLDEANAVQARIDETNKELSASSGPSQGRMQKEMTGTRWAFPNGVIATFGTGGSVEMGWPKPARWTVVDDRTVRVTEPNGVVSDVTPSSDGKGALWCYRGGPGTTLALLRK